MIQPLPESQFKAGEEGVFYIGETLYHNHKLCPEINRGLVRAMIDATPAHVKGILDGRVKKKKPTPEMILGALFDKALLEPDKFKEGLSHWVRPEGMKLSTKSGIAWVKEHPGLPAIKFGEAADIQGMIESVMSRPMARRIVEEGSKQESAFCIHPPTGLLRKVRPDSRLIENSGRPLLVDLKTVFPGGTSDAAWHYHANDLRYDVQDVFYSDTYQDLIGERPFFLFLVVEREFPYDVKIFRLTEEDRRLAREDALVAMDKYQQCKESNQWDGSPDEIRTVKLHRKRKPIVEL